jgi:radical SAM protein with 4Fe4S-binding SPASM domain
VIPQNNLIKPWLLILRVTDRCNADCVYCMHRECPQHDDMPFSLAYRMIRETAGYIKEVQPIGYGEPLLYPRIVDVVAEATLHNKKSVITTNASLLTKKLSRRLLEAGLSEMRFSIEADTRKVFEFIRRPLKWHQVIKNIREFVKLKNVGGYRCLTTYCSCISPENQNDVQRITAFFKGVLGIDRGWWRRETRKPHLSDLNELYVNEHKPRYVCKHVNQYLSVNWNGDIVLCCFDIYGKYVLGNVSDRDPLAVFNSDKFNQVRQSFCTGNNYPLLCDRFCLHPVTREAWSEKSY